LRVRIIWHARSTGNLCQGGSSPRQKFVRSTAGFRCPSQGAAPWHPCLGSTAVFEMPSRKHPQRTRCLGSRVPRSRRHDKYATRTSKAFGRSCVRLGRTKDSIAGGVGIRIARCVSRQETCWLQLKKVLAVDRFFGSTRPASPARPPYHRDAKRGITAEKRSLGRGEHRRGHGRCGRGIGLPGLPLGRALVGTTKRPIIFGRCDCESPALSSCQNRWSDFPRACWVRFGKLQGSRRAIGFTTLVWGPIFCGRGRLPIFFARPCFEPYSIQPAVSFSLGNILQARPRQTTPGRQAPPYVSLSRLGLCVETSGRPFRGLDLGVG